MFNLSREIHSSSEYGLVVGAFAGAKLIGNFPAASLVDRFGRKSLLGAGVATIGLSIGAIGLAETLHRHVVSRCNRFWCRSISHG